MLNKKNKALLSILEQLYPDPKSELNYVNEYQLCISVILSAQCTDKKVNQVTPELFKKYPNFKALSKAEISSTEQIIRQVNYYKTKSKNIINLAKILGESYNFQLPLIHNELIKLPGIGRKTANVVLSELNIEPALAVDTHVFRLSNRIGISNGKDVLEVEKSLTKQFPKESWKQLHHGLILHGRRVCMARNPNCAICEIKTICNFCK